MQAETVEYTANEYPYTFIDKTTGEEIQVRASNAELATLRAWKINQNLTFKIPQPNTGE